MELQKGLTMTQKHLPETNVPMPMPMTDTSMLTNNDKELLELALATDHGTPLFKIRHFVGDAQITRYAKYKQLMLELRAREEVIEQTLVTLEKNKAHIEEVKEMIEHSSTQAAAKKLRWDLTSHVNDVAKTERRLQMAYRERGNFLQIINEMYESGEAYLEDGTDMRLAFTDPELAEQLEAEHWTYRLGKQAALDLIAYGHIGTGNLEAISMMSEPQAIKTLQLAMTFSHAVKSKLGIMESTIIEAIESGRITSTTDIEKIETVKELNR